MSAAPENQTPTPTPGVAPASPPNNDLGFELSRPARLGPTRAAALLGVGGVLLAAFFALGWLPRQRAWAELRSGAETASHGALRVQVAPPKVVTGARTVSLPGSVLPLEETLVYSRASGYVRRLAVDMGDVVQQGALLAEIDTPEVDQQVAQANAQLAQAEAGLLQAQANRELSKANLERYRQLTPSGVTSQQELDQRRAQAAIDEANVRVAEANVTAQRANLRRLGELKSFARVVAPFAGRVNTRLIERGALVSPATPLFRVSATDPVRVIVQVPQDLAPGVQVGSQAKVGVREYSGRAFEGQVARSAGALDASTRTMPTEVRVPNPNGELLAGMYAQVTLTLPSPRKLLELPATALMSDARGQRVAIVGDDGALRLLPVEVERDTGATIEIASGLQGSERVVRLASASLEDGRKVEVVP